MGAASRCSRGWLRARGEHRAPPCPRLPQLIPGEEGCGHIRRFVTRFVPRAGEEPHVPPRPPKPPHDAGTRGCQQARAVQRGRVTGWLLFPVPREAVGTVTRSQSHPAAAHEPGEPSCGVGKFLMSSACQTGQLLTATSRGRATCRAAHAPLLPVSQNPKPLPSPPHAGADLQTDRQTDRSRAAVQGDAFPTREAGGATGCPNPPARPHSTQRILQDLGSFRAARRNTSLQTARPYNWFGQGVMKNAASC